MLPNNGGDLTGMRKSVVNIQKRIYVVAIVVLATGICTVVLNYLATDDRMRSYVVLLLQNTYLCH